MNILSFTQFINENMDNNDKIIQEIIEFTNQFKNKFGYVNYYLPEPMLIGKVNDMDLFAYQADTGTYYDIKEKYHEGLVISVLFNKHKTESDWLDNYTEYDSWFITKEDIEYKKARFNNRNHTEYEVNINVSDDVYTKLLVKIKEPETVALNRKMVLMYNFNNQADKSKLSLDAYKKIKEYEYLHDKLNGREHGYAEEEWLKAKDMTEEDYQKMKESDKEHNKMAMDILQELLDEEKKNKDAE